MAVSTVCVRPPLDLGTKIEEIFGSSEGKKHISPKKLKHSSKCDLEKKYQNLSNL